MIDVVSFQKYRALRDICFSPRALTLITGANGSGKSSLYRGLSLLQRAATGGLGLAIAREGGIDSVRWAGISETASRAAERGGHRIQGSAPSRREATGVSLGLSAGGCGYEIAVGTPDAGRQTIFAQDPVVLREQLWVGERRNRHSICLDRKGPGASTLHPDGRREVHSPLDLSESALAQLSGIGAPPEVVGLRRAIASWRFFDGFRVDRDSPLRSPAIGVRTGALASDGADLAACIGTLLEVGDADGFAEAIHDGLQAKVEIQMTEGPRFEVVTQQPGVLRPMRAHELSDGTLRYVALMAALFSARRPPVMVFNEPEASLHPTLLPALARALVSASEHAQVWVVTHSDVIAEALREGDEERRADITLERASDGAATVAGQTLLSRPAFG